VQQKVNDWCSHVQTLAAVASSQPQAAYAAFTKSLKSEWNFTMRVKVGCSVLMNNLEHFASFLFFLKIWRLGNY